MARDVYTPRGVAVPGGRLARMARLGGLAAGIAGGMAAGGARGLAAGRRPSAKDLLLTPANALRITAELARMRGAAMKVGQLMSMESGDLLPPELAEILGHLRADAHFMPPAQLKKALVAAWGPDFLKRFARFDVRPVAAASIGQVHRARTRDGRDLAVKVQYPGVRRSIDGDLRNVASLIRLSGLTPRGMDLAPLLEEARRQLHEEADYAQEGRALAAFGARLSDAPEFIVPALHADLSTDAILAMDFVEGVPIETLADAPQPVRDRIATRLIALFLRELFEFRAMQTDPNFANYRHAAETDRIILLDFGATRDFAPETAAGFRALLQAGMSGDRERTRAALIGIGALQATAPPGPTAAILDIATIAFAALRAPGPFDFGTSDLADRLRDAGLVMVGDAADFAIPPVEVLHIQRKIGGLYLLARRLRARVELGPLIAPWAEDAPPPQS